MRLERSADCPHGRALVGELCALWPASAVREGARGRLDAAAPGAELACREPPDLLFLDLETTGLGEAGTLAWLAGLAWFEPDRDTLVIEQHVLRRPGGEAAMLERLRSRWDAARLVVTFNGRAFDLPLLASRLRLARLAPLAPRPDLDLFHAARRFFGARLKDHRLVTLEEHLLGLRRRGDVPGSEAPAAWRRYLATGDDEEVEGLLHHNACDLISLACLAARWLAVVLPGPPDRLPPSTDELALAEHRRRAGEPRAAWLLLCDGAPASEETVPRALRRARLVKRLAGPTAARAHWASLVRRGEDRVAAWEELAKILEHQERDLAGARRLVLEALARFRRRPTVRDRLRKRLERLERKLGERTPGSPGHTVPRRPQSL